MAVFTDVKAAVSRHRIQAEVIGVALLAIVISAFLGFAATRSAKAMEAELGRLRAASSEVAGFRTAYRPGTPEQDSIRLPESMTVAVARDVRLSLAQRIASAAEEGGLIDVRVRFAGNDSAAAPAVPQLFTATPTVADYTMAIDASGRFASLLSLINRLPPSVALQRLRVTRDAGGAAVYHLILAVFESAKQNQHG